MLWGEMELAWQGRVSGSGVAALNETQCRSGSCLHKACGLAAGGKARQ